MVISEENTGLEMGFIICTSCTKSVSDAVESCPYCGSHLPKYITADYVPVQYPLPMDNDNSTQPPFFAVSLLKLTVLSICTFGIYEIYWFYRHWKRIWANGETTISPFWRAFFVVIFCYPCFQRIKQSGIDRGVGSAPSFGVLAIGYILATLAWRLPNPFDLISFCSVFFLIPVQSYVNRLNAAALPAHDPNSRFSIWNWIAIIVGGVWFLLAVIGSFVPNE